MLSRKILGIDPGYDRLGIAIVEKTYKGREKVLYSACFRTSSKYTIYERLESIGKEIERVLYVFEPDEGAIETLFITKNQKTAMRVSEARGIMIYEMTKYGIPVFEYSPMQIKSAITGDGRSDKSHMNKMLDMLVSLKNKIALDDEYDAIAVALTHSATVKNKPR